MGSIVLAYLAGAVTVLSPCVLPILPIVIIGAWNENRRGPLFLIAGLILSFTASGFLIATVGSSLGLTREILQKITALLLIVFGVILLIQPLYQKLAFAASGSLSGFQTKISSVKWEGKRGTFILGFLLGLMWAPCAGPTLGAAIALASQLKDLPYAFIVMLSFSLGIATPMLIMAMSSQAAMLKIKAKLTKVAPVIKFLTAITFLVLGILLLTGAMHEIEIWVLEQYPDWLIKLTTRF